jgi:hypothetical protein
MHFATDATESDLELPPWAQRMTIVFWWFFALATVILMPGTEHPERVRQLSLALRVLVSPLAPLFLWVILHAAREPLRAAVRRLAVPFPMRFVLVGAVLGLALSFKFAAHGDLAGGLPIAWGGGVLAYFGVYCAVLTCWFLLRGLWAFSYHHVFWIGGLAFALVEENRVVFRTLLAGDVLGGSLLLGYLTAVYGLPFASVFLVMPPEDLPTTRRHPDALACLACAILPLMLYKYWGVAWHCMLGSLCL